MFSGGKTEYAANWQDPATLPLPPTDARDTFAWIWALQYDYSGSEIPRGPEIRSRSRSRAGFGRP